MLTTLAANGSCVADSSGGGESANIYAIISVNNFSHGSLPRKSRSRKAYCRPAILHLSSGPTNSLIVFLAPLTRTHCPPPPYCLCSLARSSSFNTTHTSPRTALIGYCQRKGVCTFTNPACTGEELVRAGTYICN